MMMKSSMTTNNMNNMHVSIISGGAEVEQDAATCSIGEAWSDEDSDASSCE